MKKKIFSIGLIVVLVLSSLMLSATPAAAADLAWSNQLLFGQNQVVAPGNNVSIIRVAPNGDVFAVSGLNIYKSVDGGRTYGIPVNITGAASIADLQVSPAYDTDNTVVVLGQNAAADAQVYISTNGGAVYGALGAALNPGSGETGTSVAIAPNYVGGYGGIIAGTQDGAGGGDVYEYSMAGWVIPLGGALAEDVYALTYSPNYPIDATMLAVSANTGAGAGTYLHTKVATSGWDVNIGGAPVVLTPDKITPDVIDATEITSADIATPSDFNGSLAFNRTVYVAVDSTDAANDDKIYRVNAGQASDVLDTSTLVADDAATSVAYSGTQTAGTLYVGAAAGGAQVYRSTNAYPTAPAVLISFLPANPAPSGTTMTQVALAADYTSSNTVYAGTSGAEAAFNVSTNGGAAFYQAGLINTTINTITDFQAVSATQLFMVTEDGGAGLESIWKTMDGGLTWYRISTYASATNTVIVRPSPDYATDSTLYLAEVGAQGMMLSNDGGDTWTPRTAPANIGDVAVKDMYTIYVGTQTGTGDVYSSFNGGFFFSMPMATNGPVYDLALDLATGHILVGDTGGKVAISQDGSTFNGVGLATPFAANVIVAFDANYGDNNYIYGADTAAAGVWQVAYTPGPPVVWPAASIDGGACALPGDILVAPDGTLYASDATAAALGPVVGGVVRIINPAAPGPKTVDQVSVSSAPPVAPTDDGLIPGDTLTGLTMAEGSNIIWAINNLAAPGPYVRTYTDTLSTATPPQVSPANAEIFAGATSATFVWDAVSGATSYQVRYSTRTDFLAAATLTSNPVNSPLTAVVTNAANFAGFVTLVPGMTYYWQVQIIAPVTGPWSEVWSFQTQLTPGAPNAPGIIPAAGGVGNTGPGGTQVTLMPTFQWGTVPGATGYEFELATDAGMNDVIVSEILTATAYQATTALDYSTTYYWRVRGVSATSETAWSPVTAFTTMDEPAPPVEPSGGDVTVNVPTQEPPEIVIPTQPAPQITVTTGDGEGVAPGYIWAVIIIGAVLVIALIVLIVRTRRTV